MHKQRYDKTIYWQGKSGSWLKKVRQVARFQLVGDVANLLPLYLEGDTLGLYMEMDEDDQRDMHQIEVWLKEVFINEPTGS